MNPSIVSSIKSECEKRGIKSVDVYECDTPMSEGSFEVFENEDEYVFSIDKNGIIQ